MCLRKALYAFLFTHRRNDYGCVAVSHNAQLENIRNLSDWRDCERVVSGWAGTGERGHAAALFQPVKTIDDFRPHLGSAQHNKERLGPGTSIVRRVTTVEELREVEDGGSSVRTRRVREYAHKRFVFYGTTGSSDGGSGTGSEDSFLYEIALMLYLQRRSRRDDGGAREAGDGNRTATAEGIVRVHYIFVHVCVGDTLSYTCPPLRV